MTTPNLGMTKPTVGADADAWGGELNTDLDLIDLFATKPTRQKLTSGTAATYTPPANCRFIRVTIKGAGGGSVGNGTGGQTNGGVGGTTSFGGVTALGGNPSLNSTNGAGALGGSGGNDNSLVVSRRAGAPGGPPSTVVWSATNFVCVGGLGGGKGGGTPVIGGASSTGNPGTANSGGGAPGSTVGSNTQTTLATFTMSGGAGEGEEAVFWLPATTYTYTVGVGGTAGGLGTSGVAGLVGTTGVIDVEEFY